MLGPASVFPLRLIADARLSSSEFMGCAGACRICKLWRSQARSISSAGQGRVEVRWAGQGRIDLFASWPAGAWIMWYEVENQAIIFSGCDCCLGCQVCTTAVAQRRCLVPGFASRMGTAAASISSARIMVSSGRVGGLHGCGSPRNMLAGTCSQDIRALRGVCVCVCCRFSAICCQCPSVSPT